LHVSGDLADILACVMCTGDATEYSSEFPDSELGVADVMESHSPAQSSDPLKTSVPLAFHHVLFPFGFPVQIKSNEQAVIRAAELSWGSFTHRFRETPLEVRFLIAESASRRKPPDPVFRAQSNLLTIVADTNNFATCDLISGFGFACLTKAAVMNRDYLRYQFLEAMVYVLLDTSHLVAMHAACVGKDGRGVLLVGDSGAGKSSLAYACARRGWTYVSDDASSLVLRRPGRVVLGNPQAFRFRPSATHLFPELHGTTKSRNGKLTMEIRTEHLAHMKTANESEIGYIVFLNRMEVDLDSPRLDPVSREEVLRRLVENPWPSELLIHDDRVAAIERLLEARCYELTYKQFGPAIDLLERMIVRGNT
jgi:hypothetical protein